MTAGNWTAERILGVYAEVFPKVAPAHLNPDSCLAATRVSLTMLALFAIKAVPVPVQLLVYNPAMLDRMQRGLPRPTDPAELDALGCWSLGIGFGTRVPRQDGWDGHMVLVTDSPLLATQVLLDPALGQASRPEHDMALPGALVLPGPLPETEPLLHRLPTGTTLAYRRHPEAPPWEQTPAWGPERQRVRSLLEIALCRALSRRGVPLNSAAPLPDIRPRKARRA